MIRLLAKIFFGTKNLNYKDYSNSNVRHIYGILCSGLAIFLNLILFVAKWLIGHFSLSIAIVSDGFNNLSDAAACMISVAGFYFSKKKADSKHPFGYGRLEYINALVISILILFTGFSLGKTSIDRIFHPEEVEFNFIWSIVLGLSILVKIYMAIFYKVYAKRINSKALAASGTDSFLDIISTAVVLISGIIGYFFGINIDGFVGLAVSAFIVYSGINSLRDTTKPLLGEQISLEVANEIEKLILSHSEVLGIHDLLVHDYGPKRKMLSIHVEIDGKTSLFYAHEIVDAIERELFMKFEMESVLHIDPIFPEDERTRELKAVIEKIVKSIDTNLSIHDFRVSSLRCVQFDTDNQKMNWQNRDEYLRLSFDVLITDDVSKKFDDKTLQKMICDEVRNVRPDCVCNIKFDRGIL